MVWPLEVDWSCDCMRNMPIDNRDGSLALDQINQILVLAPGGQRALSAKLHLLYLLLYGMPSTRLARAYENVFWLDDRGDNGPCRRVGAS